MSLLRVIKLQHKLCLSKLHTPVCLLKLLISNCLSLICSLFGVFGGEIPCYQYVMQFASKNLLLNHDNDVFLNQSCFLFQLKSKKIHVNLSSDYVAQNRYVSQHMQEL